jgi:hypothetical protein
MAPREPALGATAGAVHAVQLYKADAQQLVLNVGEYLAEGLTRGEGVLVFATGRHSELFLRRIEELGGDPASAIGSGRMLLLDASETLSRFIGDGKADWKEFEKDLRGTAARVCGASSGGLRAYGEMVGILWAAGKYAAALRLERLWNRLLGELNFSLYCGYPIDIFGSEFQLGAMEALLCAHTHLAPGTTDPGLDEALRAAMDEVLGRRAEGVRSLMRAAEGLCPAVMPRSESEILWLRSNLPDEADRVLGRARQYYEESKRLETREISQGARH